MNLKDFIRDIPDFPRPGILFKDITPLLENAEAFQAAIESLAKKIGGMKIDKLVAVESRGFLFGAPLANKLGLGLAIARKKGKLPYKTISTTFTLEYGSETIEMHQDALKEGERVLLIDDVLATGGTSRAAGVLAEQLGAKVAGYAFLIELDFLKGRERLGQTDIITIMNY
jgi:adenine phosphoribosyltransferase